MYSFISKETTHLNEGKTVQVTTEQFFAKIMLGAHMHIPCCVLVLLPVFRGQGVKVKLLDHALWWGRCLTDRMALTIVRLVDDDVRTVRVDP